MEERISAHGHEHVSADHASTFEVTTDDFLTPAGDCILAIEADRAPADFAPKFVDACQDADATITAMVEVDGMSQSVTGSGHPDLSFQSERSAVIRASDHVDERTVTVNADHGAIGIDDELVDALAAGAELTLTLAVE
ncbi:DUF371 domain-containing protein [Natranaeroarchaeum aerophilus]|uniref:DUF371 domain-containing protein n=1 Tax=Natranaeroarchaeum aerophilus TaxID=2917711 RepID=A0AAE3K5W9_9EURY|nr:DUF371 domain-containing protein [Natranaeroarchaeum aerophilus]MCL9814393.1 DUF371 domain-containing protein [Natranaeroarchaeum aerophilus]